MIHEREALIVFKQLVRVVSGTLLGSALCLSSTAAMAAKAPAASAFAPVSISPFVALSAYGTMQSRSAVCASAVGASAVAAAAEGQAAPGCVLPILDPVAPVVVETAPVGIPVAAVPVGGGFGFGIGALLAGLVAIAGLAAVLLANGDDDDLLPISAD